MLATPLRIFAAIVYGIPRPQGSKTPYPFVKTFPDGRPMYRKDKRGNLIPILGVRMAEGRAEKREEFEQWRTAIATVARVRFEGEIFDEPLIATYSFFLPMPKKSQFPEAPAGKPDLDKLMRAVNDALTGIVFVDDSRVVRDGGSGKFWADPRDERGPRVQITVRPI